MYFIGASSCLMLLIGTLNAMINAKKNLKGVDTFMQLNDT